jgi:hypothetical protein
MPRRRKSAFSPAALVGILAAAGLAVGGYFLVQKKGSDPFDGVAQFDAAEYVENSTSFRGNTYQVTATVNKQLKYTDQGRLFAVSTKAASGGETVDFAVLFPKEFASESINIKDELRLKVEVDRNGLLIVQAKHR